MAICAAALLLGGCASSTTAPKPKTALEIREMQTRSFETTDQKMVMKSLLNVLQDEGFIVKTANVELGLLTAEKDVEVSGSAASSGSGVNTGTAIALGVVELALRLTVARDAPASTPSTPSSSNNSDDRWARYRNVECSANISEYGTQTRVRINFQVKVIDNKGAVMSVEQVEDPRFYQEFFAKVDKGLFITQEKL
jgi:hypothetical protein